MCDYAQTTVGRLRRALILMICVQIGLVMSLGAAIAVGHAREGSNATPPASVVIPMVERI